MEHACDHVWFHGFLFELASMGVNRKLIRWIWNFLFQRKLIILINKQFSDPITPIYSVAQGSHLSSIIFFLYISNISQHSDAQVNLSQFTDDIVIWAHAPGICSVRLRLKSCMNEILTWCDGWRIELNHRKN